MKKVLLTTFAFISLTIVKAQQGSILAGGNIGIGTSKSSSTPNSSEQRGFSFNPVLGYQFAGNWTAGAVAGIQNSKNINSNGSVTIIDKNSSVGIGPFVRYTRSLSDIFYVFGQLQGNFGSTKSNGTKTHSFAQVSAFPAIFVNVKNGFGLNFAFGGIEYQSYNPTGASGTTSSFSLSFGQTANIGISKNLYFKKK